MISAVFHSAYPESVEDFNLMKGGWTQSHTTWKLGEAIQFCSKGRGKKLGRDVKTVLGINPRERGPTPHQHQFLVPLTSVWPKATEILWTRSEVTLPVKHLKKNETSTGQVCEERLLAGK
uniref:Uncharacterized protein n=1 Tax=Micrurus corallinus TaxID=54390 RepID=A0A2D4GBQ3_MICCO